MTDDDVVEEPVEDEHGLQTPETPQREDEDEDEDTDTDDGAVGGDEDSDGIFSSFWYFADQYLVFHKDLDENMQHKFDIYPQRPLSSSMFRFAG